MVRLKKQFKDISEDEEIDDGDDPLVRSPIKAETPPTTLPTSPVPQPQPDQIQEVV